MWNLCLKHAVMINLANLVNDITIYASPLCLIGSIKMLLLTYLYNIMMYWCTLFDMVGNVHKYMCRYFLWVLLDQTWSQRPGRLAIFHLGGIYSSSILVIWNPQKVFCKWHRSVLMIFGRWSKIRSSMRDDQYLK